MARPEDLVSAALAQPDTMSGWSPATWTLAVQQARAAGLLGRLAQRARASKVAGAACWPEGARAHADSALRVVRAQQDEVRREVAHLQRALAELGAPVVLLKGAAYVMANLPAAEGRVFSDVDIMVPKAAITQAESLLMLAGWMTTHHSAYDQRYYRQWMHELPPLQHLHRQTTLDVHHGILPETSRLRPDASKLLAAAIPLPDRPGFYVLAPVDMVLHSMVHLVMNDDMGHALRDLSDIDLLLRHFSADPDFWQHLVARAAELDLRRPLFFALRACQRQLTTPVPADLWRAVHRYGPRAPMRWLMDAIWSRAIRPPAASVAPRGRALALFALYLRGHWLRMPPLLLLRHLTIKALRLHESDPRADGV